MKKKYYFLILLFILLCPFVVDARREMSEIQASYPEGSVYSEHYTYLAWSCADNSCHGVQTNAYQCAGFAARVYRDYFGVDSSWANTVTDVNGIYRANRRVWFRRLDRVFFSRQVEQTGSKCESRFT